MPTFQDLSNAVRFLSIDAVNAAKSGHPGMPMGMADIATVLFRDFLRFDPKNPNWDERDRFVVSNGHGSMLLYSLLHLTGYDVSLNDIKNFRQLNSKTAGHPEYGHCEGVETTTGPLGQGIATAVGMALGQKIQAEKHGIAKDARTFVTVGDGCLMEGISHEAAELAVNHKLDNLILLFDDNNISIDGEVNITSRTNIEARFLAYGFHVIKADGHNENAIHKAIQEATKVKNVPTLICFKTQIGFGSPNKANTSGVHGSPLGDDERALVAKELNWPYAPFEVPVQTREAWHAIGNKVSAHANKEIQKIRVNKLDDFIQALKKETAETTPNLATRKASGKVLETIESAVPALLSGSADLTGSVNTRTPSMETLTAENRNGTYLHYGVREHAMGAVMNGLALTGFLPISGTFLGFADYMKPAMRLSSMMNQNVTYVLTHDSIGLGEDGPTHQPIEHLSMLRAMPNLHVFRPCDLAETAECWQLALTENGSPAGMVLSRQGMPTQRLTYTEENLCAKGAYVLVAENANKPLDAVLMASGSEVHLATQAATELKTQGKNVRVISVPCMDIFLEQTPIYQAGLLPAGVKRIAIEAAARQSWDRFLNDGDIFIGMDNGNGSVFGASAPAEELYAHFGITKEAIVEAVND